MDDVTIKEVFKLSERKKIIEAAKNAFSKKANLEFPDKTLKEVDVVEVPINLLIYNPDNTRYLEKIIDKVANLLEKDVSAEEAYDYFYTNRENIDIQTFLHDWSVTASKDRNKNIYKEIKSTKNQTYPILIDSSGIVVDGNRRLSVLRDLYIENPTLTGYKSFEQVECKVIPGSHNRILNTDFEKIIHRKEDLQLKHGWFNEAIRIEQEFKELFRAKGSGAQVKPTLENLANDLNKSYKETENIVSKAAAVRAYYSWRKTYDKDFEGYEQLSNERIEQDMEEIGKVLLSQAPLAVKNLKLAVAFAVVYGHTFEYAKYKRSYEVIRNSNKLVGYFEKISKNKDNKENFKEIKELLSGGEKEIEKLCKKIQKEYEKDNVKREIDKENQLVLATLKRASTGIENMEVTDKTLLKKDKASALNLLKTLQEQLEKKEKEVKKIKYL